MSAGRYAVRRIARIVPAYYACLAGCLLLYAAAGMNDLIPPQSDLPMSALFAQNYSSHDHGHQRRDLDPLRRRRSTCCCL